MAKQIFLSYGREQEVQAFVIRLKHDLESHGFTVWLDLEDIPAGSDWHAAIGYGLHNCRGLIAVITNKYLSSRYCTSELYTADSDQKSIFPVIFEDVNFEQSQKSMGVKYVISGINWSFFRPEVDDYASSLNKLMQGMTGLGLGADKSVEDVDSVSDKVSQLQISPGQHGAPPTPQAAPAATQPCTPSPSHSNQSAPGTTVTYPHQPHALIQPSPPRLYYQHQFLPPLPAVPPGSQYPGATPPMSNAQYPRSTSPVPFYSPATPPQHPAGHPPYYPPAGHFPGPYPVPPYYPGYSPQYPATGAGGYAPPPPPPQVYGAPYAAGNSNQAPPQYGELYPEDQSSTNQDSPLNEKPPMTVASAPPPPTTPAAKKRFRVGVKLEALDRRFPYYICVATIMDRKDNGEVRVHFDGWGEEYDYWCHSDDIELHPVGWCSKHDYELYPTRGIEWQGWNKYLTDTQSEGADNSYFNEVQLAAPGSLHFRPGMRLEAKNRLQSGSVCVATVDRIADGKLLIHFDGWTSKYDFWCSPDSADIHPAMWSGKHSMKVQPPKDHVGKFLWNHYLCDPDVNPAPAHIFTKAQLGLPGEGTGSFEVGMKLEAKDRLNPGLICVATITNKEGDKILIHFDGWSNYYDYWCQKTTTDIHPVGWCRDHSRALQKPKDYAGVFSWSSYLDQTISRAVPHNAFTQAQKN